MAIFGSYRDVLPSGRQGLSEVVGKIIGKGHESLRVFSKYLFVLFS